MADFRFPEAGRGVAAQGLTQEQIIFYGLVGSAFLVIMTALVAFMAGANSRAEDYDRGYDHGREQGRQEGKEEGAENVRSGRWI